MVHNTTIVAKYAKKVIDHRAIWLVPVATAALLIVVSWYNFLAFHTLAELFSIIICLVLFALAWSTDQYRKDTFFVFLACGYFWIGGLDLVHALVYKGMNVFTEGSGNLASQFWIVTRYAQALLLLVAPLVIHKNINKLYLYIGFGCSAAFLCWLVFSGLFPTTFIEGKGLTSFKVYSEYVIIGMLVLAFILLRQKRPHFSSYEFNLISASIIFTIIAELAFTLYVSVYGLSNLVGHLFKIFAFWMIFQVIVVVNLRRPYDKLIESLNYNRLLFDTSPIGLALAHMDGTLIDINAAYADIVGRSVEEITKLTYWDITPEKYAAAEQEQLHSLETTGRYGPYVKEYIHADGHLIPVQLSGRLIDHNGESCIWSSVEDITERVRAEQELRVVLERQQKNAEHLPGFIYTFRQREDGSFHFPYASEGIRAIYGCDPEDVVDDAGPVFSVIHPDDMETVKNSIQESRATMGPWACEYRVKLPDGSIIWVEGHSSPTKESDGSFVWHGYIQNITDRIMASNEIKRQRDQVRRYLDLAGTLIIVLNTDGEIRMINKYGCHLLGYDEDYLVGRNWFDVAIPSDIREEIRGVALKILQGELDQVGSYENEVITKSGERRMVAWNNTYVRNADGDIDALLSSGKDVTAERQSQQALMRSNRALRTISLCNEALVQATNEEQLLNDICRVIVEHGGYKLAWTAFLRHDGGRRFVQTAAFGITKEIIEPALSDINAYGLTSSVQPQVICSATSVHQLPKCVKVCELTNTEEMHMFPLLDAGTPFGALFIACDKDQLVGDAEVSLLSEMASDLSYGLLSQRVERERAYAMDQLGKSEERSLAVIEGAHDAIIAIDPKGNMTQVNPAALDMFGITRKAAIGANVDMIIPERFRAGHRTGLKHFAKTHKSKLFGKNIDLYGLRADGSEFPIELTLSPMPKSTTDLCTAMIRDTSDRMEADRQRRQAQNMESLGNLAGGMAHDINNMLLPILNLTTMVRRTLDAGSGEDKKLGMVLQAAERVQGLVKNVLEFSRQDDPDYADQDIHNILDHVLPLIKSTTPSSITITPSIRDFKAIIHVDEKQLSAALINLVTNAVDAIGGKNGHIKIELNASKPSPSLLRRNTNLRAIPYAKLSIIDDGSGMSPEVVDRIFDPFFTTKAPGKGTGLGMSMVHGIVSKIGGTVHVESSEGKGTRVDLYLPLKQTLKKRKLKPKPKPKPKRTSG